MSKKLDCSTEQIVMTKFAWVALGMLTAGIGGAAATWASMNFFTDLQPQQDGEFRSLTSLGGVFAGFCGGVVSLGRGSKRGRDEILNGLAALFLGVVGTGVINPGLLFSPLLLVVAPLQGLAALLGGFATIAALWAILWMAGIRDDTVVQNARTNGVASPLKISGLIALALSLVLPCLTDAIAVQVIGAVAFYLGILLFGIAMLQDVMARRSNQPMQRTRHEIGRDG
jgi:hypothetical protein